MKPSLLNTAGRLETRHVPSPRLAWRLPLLALCWLGAGRITAAPLADLQVFPKEVSLSSARDFQSIVVQAKHADGLTCDVTAQASFSLAATQVARWDGRSLHPLADGRTALHVTWEGRSLEVPLVVSNTSTRPPLSFKLDVVPVLTKAGCNSGGCHGASRGKDGFRLSLFGYDPDGDYTRLTREQVGRRINLALPDESLLLEKGLGRVPHGGGERFKADSDLHRTLLEWLRAAAPADPPTVAQVTGIELMPAAAVLAGEGATQQLVVRARYSDGTDRDVTSLAVFLSSHDSSARVSESGWVTAGQRGEAFVLARFDEFSAGAQVIVVPKDLAYAWPTNIAGHNYIDTLVHAKLRKLRLRPSDVCDDATFIRRASLDLNGALPTPAAVKRFVEDPAPGKRAALVESLMQRPEFSELWVMKWAELLQIRTLENRVSPKAALHYFRWLQDRLARNEPMDRIVRELLTASGSTLENPAANYYQVEPDTLKLAENTAQVFMGMRIQCAQCHNHPFDRWTMNDYYRFAAFFPQVGRKNGEDPRETIVFDRGDGEVKHPVHGRAMTPKFLGGDAPEIKGQSRREVLARWMASPQNPHFARNLANIVWAHFLGRGIVEPVDDVRISNPAVNPELLDALAAKFTESQYDLRRLVRDICTSRTYQLSTQPNDTNALDDRNFSRAALRRLRAEVLLDCISQVTETRNKFPGLPLGARAVHIADGNTSTYFLNTFGRATRETVCSCEVKVEPNLSQALHLLNGDTVHDKIQSGAVVKNLLKSGQSPSAIIEELYLRCFARKPTPAELEKLTGFAGKSQNVEQTLNDLFWSLLNAKEFVFNR